jgi:hypothetical protein
VVRQSKKTFWPLKMGSICRIETSVTAERHSLSDIPALRGPDLHLTLNLEHWNFVCINTYISTVVQSTAFLELQRLEKIKHCDCKLQIWKTCNVFMSPKL